MSDRIIKKSLFPIIVSLSFLLMFTVETLPQCGVYLKHKNTQLFNYQNIYLSGSHDMTGDGIPDVIGFKGGVGNASYRSGVLIIPNNGDGTFGTPTFISPPEQTSFNTRYAVGKIDNDSLNDLALIVESSPRMVWFYKNNGNGTFTPFSTTNVSPIGEPFYILDLNNDGFGDYLGYSSSQFKYSLGNGTGSFGAPVVISPLGIGYPGDFNNDGFTDFINSRNLYLNDGNANFSTTDISSFFSFNEVVGAVKDFNGDGKSDVFIQNLSNTARDFYILTRTDSSFVKTQHPVSTDPNFNGFGASGNFSGDSSPDILFSVRYQNKKIVFTNDGAGNFTRQEYKGNFFIFNFHTQAFNDFDNDGKTDWLQLTSGTSNSTLMFRDKTSITFQKNVCDRPGQTRIVDFDNSNTTDFSFWQPSTGDWSVMTNSDGTRQTETVNWGLGSHGDIPSPGDFDGDGVTDRAVYRNSTGVWYIRRSSDLTWFVFQFGLTGDKPAAADFDGDTVTDIAVFRPSDGIWYIWFMGTQQFYAVHFGLNGDKPVPADFDGDFKSDVAVYRPSTGVWYYLRSSDGSFGAVQWGIDTDKPMPADFDGDGKADFSVYRESENNLYVLKSSDNLFAGIKWGISGDIPYFGDFDGDFVADFGVYRPSTKQWWNSNIQLGGAIFGEANSILTSTIPRIE